MYFNHPKSAFSRLCSASSYIGDLLGADFLLLGIVGDAFEVGRTAIVFGGFFLLLLVGGGGLVDAVHFLWVRHGRSRWSPFGERVEGTQNSGTE